MASGIALWHPKAITMINYKIFFIDRRRLQMSGIIPSREIIDNKKSSILKPNHQHYRIIRKDHRLTGLILS